MTHEKEKRKKREGCYESYGLHVLAHYPCTLCYPSFPREYSGEPPPSPCSLFLSSSLTTTPLLHRFANVGHHLPPEISRIAFSCPHHLFCIINFTLQHTNLLPGYHKVGAVRLLQCLAGTSRQVRQAGEPVIAAHSLPSACSVPKLWRTYPPPHLRREMLWRSTDHPPNFLWRANVREGNKQRPNTLWHD